MDNIDAQLLQYRDKIPQFVFKLYHILERNQHPQYLRWYDGNQILIRHPKKFQQKVLPKYFRHKHMSSFIRQLNMYKFGKVAKIIKQKNHMYFKNQNFKKGEIAQLTRIKRNNKKTRTSEQTLTPPQKCQHDDVQQSENVSINKKLHQYQEGQKKNQNKDLVQYKKYIKNQMNQIKTILSRLSSSAMMTLPLQNQLKPVKVICDEILQIKEPIIPSFGSSLRSLRSSDMLINSINSSAFLKASYKAIPSIENIKYPSNCSLINHYQG